MQLQYRLRFASESSISTAQYQFVKVKLIQFEKVLYINIDPYI